MPRHINPTDPQRTATAPYNFVPSPQRVFTVEEGIEVNGQKIKPWEMHDRFVPGTHSGCIELSIETLTPLYIRGAVTQDAQANWDTREARLRPEPYCYPDGTPAIPGSSLRGMVRTLVEILSFAKIQPVSDAKPFFRTVDTSRIGLVYRSRMVSGDERPRGGILRLRDGGATIEPRHVLRVPRQLLEGCGVRFRERDPNWTPPWPQQHGPCWVKVGRDSSEVDDIQLQKPQGDGWREGILVMTGNAPRKRHEFVFVEPDEPCQPICVPDRVLERFHDEDQLTQWQERAFPTDRPRKRCRRAPGHLRDDEPVFFLTKKEHVSNGNPDGLVFLGRAQMFRLPYDLSPSDLVPSAIGKAGFDLAEVMFGRVERHCTIKGRVQFEDAVAVKGGPQWYESLLVPRILSAPKPTAFQHYLTQDGTQGKEQLTTYLQGDYTTIRGHKLYWHRWEEKDGISQVKETEGYDSLLADLQRASPDDTQHTLVRPVKAGVAFEGRVRFENLTDIELGALLTALQLPEGCCHRLGMGKPLGLGSVRITARLQLVDRSARYRAWQGTGVVDGEDGSRFRTAFENAIIEHARKSDETLLTDKPGLRQIARLDAVYLMLSWDTRPPVTSTSYMDLERFRQRRVLPTPHAVVRAPEPPWPTDPPRPDAASSTPSPGPRPGRKPARGRSSGRPAPRGEARTPPPSGARGAGRGPSGQRPRHQRGEQITVTRVKDPSGKGKIKFQADDGFLGHFAAEPPPDVPVGERVQVWVANVSSQGYTFTRKPPKGKKP